MFLKCILVQKVGFVKYKSRLLHGHKMKNTQSVLRLLYTRSYTASKPASLHIRLVTGGLFLKIVWPVREVVPELASGAAL